MSQPPSPFPFSPMAGQLLNSLPLGEKGGGGRGLGTGWPHATPQREGSAEPPHKKIPNLAESSPSQSLFQGVWCGDGSINVFATLIHGFMQPESQGCPSPHHPSLSHQGQASCSTACPGQGVSFGPWVVKNSIKSLWSLLGGEKCKHPETKNYYCYHL